MHEDNANPRYAVLGYETSGNKRSNKIIELNVLIVEEENKISAKIVDSYHTLINPETKVSEAVLEETGITLEELNVAPLFSDIAEDFIALLEGQILLTTDLKEKVKQLEKELKKAGHKLECSKEDIADLIEEKMPELADKNLSTACHELGIVEGKFHRPIDEAIAITEVLQNLRYDMKTNNGVEISYSKIHAAHPALDLKQLARLSYRPGLLQLYNDGRAVYVERFESLAKEVPKYLVQFKSDYDQEIDSIQLAQFHDPLIALLKKEERIRRLKPSINYNQRREAWGVFHSENPFDLKVAPLLKGKGTLLHYALNEEDAERWIDVQKQVASQDEYTYVDMEDKKLMARLKKEREKLLRAKIRPLLEYPHDDFVVMGPGRDDDELSCHFFVKRKLFGHAFLSGQQVYGLDKCPKSVKPIKENDFLKFLILKELENWTSGTVADHSIKIMGSEKKVQPTPVMVDLDMVLVKRKPARKVIIEIITTIIKKE